MTLTNRLGIALLITVVLFLTAISLGPLFASASAPSGLQSTVSTTSSPTVNTTPALVFATSTCAARIISTNGSAIYLSIADANGNNVVPSAGIGIFQATGTTAVYDSGLYGCGAFRVYSNLTQTLTVSEAR